MLNLSLWRISFLLLLGLFLLYNGGVESLRCGRVWDGPNRHKEVEWQRSLTTLSANWDYFEDNNNTKDIQYEYAIISQTKFTPAIERSSHDAPVRNRCRNNTGIIGRPDVVSWHKVKGRKRVTWTGLSLRPKHRYYFIIKARQGSQFIFTNTHGITVGLNGSINRTRSDDDDDFADYKAGLIAMGIAICCILCLLLLLLLAIAKGKGEDKYTTTVHRENNVEK
jgi:hypothetical protein